jgi:predicted nucleic acid-binding protein
VTKASALLDSNVIIASLAEAHEHHDASIALFGMFPDQSFAVAAHSYSEAYSILTRKAQSSPFKWTATDAIAALESVAVRCSLVGLTHGQTFEVIRDFAADGGIGSRLYDKLIGEAAVHNGLSRIITWNASHMRSLFPSLDVASPVEFAAAAKRKPPELRGRKNLDGH